MITEHDRKLVQLMVTDTAKYERQGIREAKVLGFRLRRDALLYTKRRRMDLVLDLIRYHFTSMKENLRESMIWSYLAGIKRSNLLSTLSYQRNDALQFLTTRLNISNKQLKRIEEYFDSRAVRVLGDLNELVSKKVEQSLIEIMTDDLHVKDAVDKLRKTFDSVGITPENSYTLENIFRTQTQLAYGAAKWQADQSPIMQEILWGYKYVTAGDDRVRPSHELLDGVTLPKEHPFWQTSFPPNGWSCRCQAIELFREMEIKKPPSGPVNVDGVLVSPEPDEGFRFNPGVLYNELRQIVESGAA